MSQSYSTSNVTRRNACRRGSFAVIGGLGSRRGAGSRLAAVARRRSTRRSAGGILKTRHYLSLTW